MPRRRSSAVIGAGVRTCVKIVVKRVANVVVVVEDAAIVGRRGFTGSDPEAPPDPVGGVLVLVFWRTL